VAGTIADGLEGVTVSDDGNFLFYALQGNNFPSAMCIGDCGGGPTFFAQGLAPSPLVDTIGSDIPDNPPSPTAGNYGVTATIRAGDPNAKKNYCAHQSNMAAIEVILPGGSVLLGGDYSPTAVGGEAGEEAISQALDAGAKSTGFLSMVRSWTGIPMSVTSKVLTGLGYTLTAYDLYKGMKAMQREFAACIK